MNKITLRSLFIVVALLLTVLAALVWARQANPQQPTVQIPPPAVPAAADALLSMQARLSQGKVALSGNQQVSMAISISAVDAPPAYSGDEMLPAKPVDMVVVLDRSGSMQGSKLQNAKSAIMALAGRLTPHDRMALISYSDGVTLHSTLSKMTQRNRDALQRTLLSVVAQGGTNLGSGFAQGISLCEGIRESGRSVRLVLISDGHANQGVVEPSALGGMARAALQGEFAISAVGVGVDFNEHLMTTIADRGLGSYHFLENPTAFASVFLHELGSARMAAAGSLEVRIPLLPGASLLTAGGYPVEHSSGSASFFPGDIQYGQTRTIHVTMRLPLKKAGEIAIPSPILRYRADVGGLLREIRLQEPLTLVCVADEGEAIASLDRDVWADKVVQEDYSRLKEEVAKDVSEGNEQQALGRISRYREEKARLNAVVGSEAVRQNLESEVSSLRDEVREVQAAPEPSVARKQASKKLQHEGYAGRRDKQQEALK